MVVYSIITRKYADNRNSSLSSLNNRWSTVLLTLAVQMGQYYFIWNKLTTKIIWFMNVNICTLVTETTASDLRFWHFYRNLESRIQKITKMCQILVVKIKATLWKIS